MSIISGANNTTVFVSGDEIGTIYIGKYSNIGGVGKYDKVIVKMIDQVHGPILKICGSPLKNYFFLCGDISGAIMKLNVNALFAAELKTIGNHQYQVCDMDIHKNGNLLVTCSNDAIKLWDIKMDGMSLIHTIKTDVYGMRVAFHPEKSFFVVGYADQRIRMFVLEQMNTIAEVGCTFSSQAGEMRNLVFEKSGKYFAATGYNLVYIYSFPGMEEVYCFSDNIEPLADNTRYYISDLSFTTDKKIVITTCNNKQIIQRFYNEFTKTMEIESVKNYEYSVNHLLAHETHTNENHFPAQP
jgi:WD40 repeat protein